MAIDRRVGMSNGEAAKERAEIWNKGKQHESTILDARKAAQRVEAMKTARLRELRLAKEAADRLSGEGI